PDVERNCKELFPGEAPSDDHITARIFKQKLTKLIDVLSLKEKIRPDQIDNIISAELLSQEEDPLLFDVVFKNMIHEPCGPLNSTSPCMKDC
ncbi:unnamed protein product, partial [Cylicostephanus goldi]